MTVGVCLWIVNVFGWLFFSSYFFFCYDALVLPNYFSSFIQYTSWFESTVNMRVSIEYEPEEEGREETIVEEEGRGYIRGETTGSFSSL